MWLSWLKFLLLSGGRLILSGDNTTGVGLPQDPFSLDGVSRVPKSPSRAYV